MLHCVAREVTDVNIPNANIVKWFSLNITNFACNIADLSS